MAGTLDNLTILPDGSFALYVRPTTYIAQLALAANTAEAVTVPTGAKYVVFGSDVSFAVRYNATTSGTAASFADDLDGDGCEVNPTIRAIRDVAEISVITAATTGNVSLAFFK
jgi:hypothetical protein